MTSATDPYGDLPGIAVTVGGGVADVVLDHPPINLSDMVFFGSLMQLTAKVAADDSVRVLVIGSADPDFWIAHFDVSAILTFPRDAPDERPTEINPFHATVETLRTMPKATIAKIAGTVRGGGAEIAASMDMRFMGRSARFGQPEVPLGILPGGSGTQRLGELVGRNRALEIVLGGDDIDGPTAEAWGWANRCLPDDELDDFVDALARRIASFPAVAIAEAKASVIDGLPDPTPGLLGESQRFNRTLRDPESARRMERFLELGGQTREVERDLPALYDDLAADG